MFVFETDGDRKWITDVTCVPVNILSYSYHNIIIHRTMTSLLAVMITFGSLAMGKLGKRLSAPAATVSQLLSQRVGKCQEFWCLAACPHVSDSCQCCWEPGMRQEGKVMRNVAFELSCHSRDLDKVGVQTHACQLHIQGNAWTVGH